MNYERKAAKMTETEKIWLMVSDVSKKDWRRRGKRHAKNVKEDEELLVGTEEDNRSAAGTDILELHGVMGANKQKG